VVYLAKFAEAVYVLHAFQKRSQRTPKRDLELAKQRLRELVTQRRRGMR
jgi:phage-related protein